jgi:hypothetical protein
MLSQTAAKTGEQIIYKAGIKYVGITFYSGRFMDMFDHNIMQALLTSDR